MPLTDAESAVATCQKILSSLRVSGEEGRAQFQSTLHPKGKICNARYEQGQGLLFHDFKDQFLEYVSKAFDGSAVMEEIMDGSPTVLVDHDIAMVWTPYSVRYNGELSHVGTNCFSLAKVCERDGEVPKEDDWQWKIVVLHDTARKASPEEVRSPPDLATCTMCSGYR